MCGNLALCVEKFSTLCGRIMVVER
ncbi:hypothetical protein MARHY1848 [Marinobacter nauticus ATCC 49840]|nr:hypothetical protein MARHY1848 [Marinobacter nauticus ATCC 49840]